jgi:hypothetical protein
MILTLLTPLLPLVSASLVFQVPTGAAGHAGAVSGTAMEESEGLAAVEIRHLSHAEAREMA